MCYLTSRDRVSNVHRHRYFSCAKGYGVLVKPEKVRVECFSFSGKDTLLSHFDTSFYLSVFGLDYVHTLEIIINL